MKNVTETKKVDCGNGYTATVNETKVHVYLDGVWTAMTDHVGRVRSSLATADRAMVTAKVTALGLGSPARSVAPAAVKTPARNSRCPRPRDCGDPTCDGSCGY